MSNSAASDANPLTGPGQTLTEDLNVTEPALYLDGIPHERFSTIRSMPGLSWHPYEGDGFWAVTRHDEIKAVSKNAQVFSSAIGHTNLWDLEADALEARRSLIDTDSPDHTRLRRLIAGAFTPRSIRVWTDQVRAITAELLDEYLTDGGGDWVEKVAAPLPIRVILAMLGVPVEDADYLVELSNYLVEGTGDQQSVPPDAFGNTTELRLLPFNSPASHALFEYGERLGELRRTDPRDDLVSLLVAAEHEGDRLSASEYRNLFHLLVFAGNETTRTALSHGAMALADNPDQWRLVQDSADVVESAAEEIIRWATPVLHMRRTAATDTELAGTEIAAGQKVVMWYASANRDGAVFDNPDSFDVTREDNGHFAFGGGGPHMCLGAFLARLEVTVLLEEMRARSMQLERVGDPERTRSNFVHGILSLDMTARVA